ncbi:MAG: sodium:proton antiporter [Planctomycetaceae bacterium]
MQVAAPSREHHELSRRIVTTALAALILSYFAYRVVAWAGVPASHAAHAASHAAESTAHGHAPAIPPALYSILPFVALLLAIAVLPLLHGTEHWWERNRNRFLVAASLGGLTLLYYAFLYGHGVMDHGTHAMSDPGLPAAVTVLKNAILVEYVPFIVLLFGLFVISGGICIEGHLAGTPRLNAGIIAIGAALASFIGTTGAAMLLIRPLLKANAKRQHVAHTVIFFIFVVCNTGGCLLPIGDPPLFLGYLRGVDFTWTLSLWPMWLFMNAGLVGMYLLWDRRKYRREDRAAVESRPENAERFAILGGVNFLWLAGVIGCVALLDPSKAFPGTHWHAPPYFREVCMLMLAALSLLSTSADIRRKNAFTYDAIIEVAALFVGIFICMQAPVQMLTTYGASLGFDTPTKFYWGTGILSSFLDNAPTYVVFFETAKSMEAGGAAIAGVSTLFLTAISLGAVFMGAMTYIGNGPNFMVKAIAESNNIKMPSFFGYMLYSMAVLLPLSVVLNLVFLL